MLSRLMIRSCKFYLVRLKLSTLIQMIENGDDLDVDGLEEESLGSSNHCENTS